MKLRKWENGITNPKKDYVTIQKLDNLDPVLFTWIVTKEKHNLINVVCWFYQDELVDEIFQTLYPPDIIAEHKLNLASVLRDEE